jgi:lysophospholipase L1-like esterase
LKLEISQQQKTLTLASSIQKKSSITAAFSLKNGVYENRDYSYSIGANPNATTLNNYLAHYSTGLYGGALDTLLPLDVVPKNKTRYLIDFHKKVVGDAGISEAKAEDVFEQIDYLDWLCHNDDKIDCDKDWKVVTLLIGANDLCIICDGRSAAQPEQWAQTIDQLVSQVHQRIPRVFLNLVSILNISQVYDAQQTSLYCRTVQRAVDECPCLEKHGDAGRQAMDDGSVAYNKALQQIAAKWAGMDDPEFTVVYQPMLSNAVLLNSTIPLSSLDCFHPNIVAHSTMALTLWNNMMSPPGQKATVPDPRVPPICATSSSFLQ